MNLQRPHALWMAVLAAVLAVPGLLGAAEPCDRQCLVDVMKNYLSALVAHDPSAVSFDREVKFTENTANIPVGYGLWVTASGGPEEFQVYAADPLAQQVVALVMMKENSGKTSSSGCASHCAGEGFGGRASRGPEGPAPLHAEPAAAAPGLVEDLAPDERTPRERMLDIGLAYYDALTGGDGALAPFARECERRENGGTSVGGKREAAKPAADAPQFPPPGAVDPEMMKLARALAVAPNTCEEQISTGVWAYISEIRNRRLLVIDEQKGLAVGFSNLYHDSLLKTIKLKGVPGVESVPAYQGTFNMPAIHIFKIRKGKIYDIEATGLILPYGTKTGWE